MVRIIQRLRMGVASIATSKGGADLSGVSQRNSPAKADRAYDRGVIGVVIGGVLCGVGLSVS
jgi:putative N-acetylmannosamine-6-phosphate epimerase